MTLSQKNNKPLGPIPDDKNVLERLAADDRRAFTELYNYYQPFIIRLLYPFREKVDAAEIVQDIFYKIWLRRELMIRVNSFKGYLLRMVRNRLIDLHKSQRIQQLYRVSVAAVNKENNISVADPVIFNELHQYTFGAIHKLPERQKKILELTILKDFGREQIAKMLGVSVWVVDKELHAATKAVRQFVEDYSRQG